MADDAPAVRSLLTIRLLYSDADPDAATVDIHLAQPPADPSLSGLVIATILADYLPTLAEAIDDHWTRHRAMNN